VGRILSKLIVFLAMLLASAVAYSDLYFMNSPETLRSTGVLHNLSLKPNTKSRLFFHYLNKTGATQNFTIRSDKKILAQYGHAVSPDPSKAGLAAYNNLIGGKKKERKLDIVIVVPSGHTVSGMIDVNADEESKVVVALGQANTNINTTLFTAQSFFKQHLISLKGTDSQKIRIGNGVIGEFKGDYGTNHEIVARNDSKAPLEVEIYVSPRGGPINLGYVLNGTWRTTGLIPAYSNVRLAKVRLAPGQVLSLSHVITGGFNYPVEFAVRSI
jgi:hypothetical protein